ncbi:hypothetical protein E3N88_31513 [Mikania micrantha]|uniref:Uncharacterized protein n=1 Tax=Mikania micrantha TaxID=192012 RepID=A0A5N6MQI2_9ASTR|nr:hypothetical protein E3N88_31513 [Mikania micrantha]
MSLDETTLVENQSHTTLSPGGTTVIQGKGLFNNSNENVRNPEITPEFLAQNRKQILLLLQKEEKEQQLKEVRAQLEFEDVSVEEVDEDDAEIEVKQGKETSQPKIQRAKPTSHPFVAGLQSAGSYSPNTSPFDQEPVTSVHSAVPPSFGCNQGHPFDLTACDNQ